MRVTNEELITIKWYTPTEKELSADLLEARELIKEVRAFCRDVAYNFDCDSDAHKYGTTCRACEAKELYEKSKEYE